MLDRSSPWAQTRSLLTFSPFLHKCYHRWDGLKSHLMASLRRAVLPARCQLDVVQGADLGDGLVCALQGAEGDVTLDQSSGMLGHQGVGGLDLGEGGHGG